MLCRQLAGLLAVALALAGCHLVFPFGVTAPDAAPGADAAGLDLRAADLHAADGPTQPGADAAPVAFPCVGSDTCVECEPVTDPLCDKLCSGGNDCDGLPPGRDPWPHCNKLIEGYDFKTCCKDWTRIHASQTISLRTCGVLEFRVDHHSTHWMQLTSTAAAKLPDDYLVEVRFFPVTKGAGWRLLLAANYEKDKQGRHCSLSFDPKLPGQVTLANSLEDTIEITKTSTYQGGGVLQSYVDKGYHYCRVGSDEIGVPLKGLLQGGTLEVAAESPMGEPALVFHLDYVRLFEP